MPGCRGEEHWALTDAVFLLRLKRHKLRGKMRSMRGILLAVLFLAALPAVAGDIEGTVTRRLRSSESREPISPFARLREEGRGAMAASGDLLAVVYLDADSKLPAGDPPAEQPVMDQRRLTIIPHILPITVGTTVRFPNSDALYHNLFSLSPARKFDLGRYPKGVSKELKFERVGEVHIFCDIHPSMSSVVLILPNRYFAAVWNDGRFVIHDVPAGSYTLCAWHELLPDVREVVVVPDSGSVHVDLLLGD